MTTRRNWIVNKFKKPSLITKIKQLCYKSLMHFAVEPKLQVAFLGIT